MASTTSEDSLLGRFIIAPIKLTSPANPTPSSGVAYKIPDGDQLSPPPYLLKPFSTAEQATIPSNAGNLAQHDNNISKLPTQTATLKITDLGKDKRAESHDMRASGAANYPTATAQVPAMMSDFYPDNLNINGVKYVKDQPEVNISAMMCVPSPSQDNASGQSIHNTKGFTAGYLPFIHQAEPGDPTSTKAAPVSLQYHQADRPAQQYRSQDDQSDPAAAARSLRRASADTVSTSALGAPSKGRVVSSYNTDELHPTMIKVLLDDGTSLCVQKDALTRFLSKHAEMFEDVLSRETFRLTQISVWAFVYLTGCIERRAQASPKKIKLSKLSNERIIDLYLTAKRFDHDWILVPCLQAIDPRVHFRDYVDDLKRVYDSGEADETFRTYFKSRFAVCMLLHDLPVSMPPHHSNLVTTMLGVDGMIASDIKLALMDEAAGGAEPKPTSRWSYDIDYDASIDRSEGSVSARRCRHCRGLPHGEEDSTIGPCGCGDWYQPTVMPKQKAALPKCSRVETAPPSESGADDWGHGDHRSYAHWEEPASMQQMPTPMDNVQRASQCMHNIIEASEVDHAHDSGWDGIPASSERMEVASASAIANDGWTVNENAQGDSWDASTDEQFVPRNNANDWSDTPRQLPYNAQHMLRPAHEAAFFPRRQLQGPAPSSSSATPPPPHRALHTPTAAPAPARVPDPPFHAPTPIHSGRFAHSAYRVPPIGMPNYVPSFGYARQAHVGNGIMHPTAPGLYGLAGRTMITTRASDGFCYDLYFQAGEEITNVVPSNIHPEPTSLGYMLQGICRGRHGFFPESFVRDRYPTAPPQARLHQQLASPFAPSRVAEAVAVDENNDDAWGSGVDKKGKARANDKQAHVSDEDVSDYRADEWGGGPAEARNDGRGNHASNNGDWGTDNAPDSGKGDWDAAPRLGR